MVRLRARYASRVAAAGATPPAAAGLPGAITALRTTADTTLASGLPCPQVGEMTRFYGHRLAEAAVVGWPIVVGLMWFRRCRTGGARPGYYAIAPWAPPASPARPALLTKPVVDSPGIMVL